MSQYKISKLLNRFLIHHTNVYYHAKFQSQGWLNTDFMKGGGGGGIHQIFKTPYHIGLISLFDELSSGSLKVLG